MNSRNKVHLISETNGNTGDTIRSKPLTWPFAVKIDSQDQFSGPCPTTSKVWLGLTPIAVFAANDNCDQVRLDALAVLIADLSAQLNANQAERASLKAQAESVQARADKRANSLDVRLRDTQARLARRTDRLAILRTHLHKAQSRRKDLQAALDIEIRAAGKYSRRARTLLRRINQQQGRIARVQAAITATTTRIKTLEQRRQKWRDQQAALTRDTAHTLTTIQTRLQSLAAEDSSLEGQITIYKTERADLQAKCDATGSGSATLAYLHTDHLGKPQFATDAGGAVIWDAGASVTPFGDGINLAAAFAQQLQFPGQYYDAETGLSHNHHRTYDPTLGRYLQSDPIGLAGGLNRYAYVGGNPVSFVDPEGLDFKAQGKIGRGDVTIVANGSIEAWIADVIPGTGRRETGVICGCGNPPNNEDMDIDFFRHNGQWWKIKHGNVTISPDATPDLGFSTQGRGLGRVFPGMMYHPDKPPRLWKWKDKDRAIEYIDNITKYSNDPNCANLPGLPMVGPQKMLIRGSYKFH